MLERLEEVEKRFETVESRLGQPEVVNDLATYQKFVKEHSELVKVVEAYRRYKKTKSAIKDSRELLRDPDPEIKALAKEELEALEQALEAVEFQLKTLLLPKDPNDDKDVIVEIRAGTGGDEAALFAADLFRMYSRYAEIRGFKVEILAYHPAGGGGFKEISASVSGQAAYSAFKYESGTHRVQRVPATEAQGRIHTSAVTVAVLPEADEVEIHIEPNELKVDVYRSTGPGGQSVNTTDSAVRITHLPTGLVVICQDEKSQHKNKAKALKVLRARLLDQKIQEQNDQIAATRKSQVGSGDRSERIRTYNFPQGRVTDHRIGLTIHRLESMLEGQIQDFVDALTAHFQSEALKGEIESSGQGHSQNQ